METNWNEHRDKIIGLGEHSLHKSYYPELQERIDELELSKRNLMTLINSVSDAIIIHDKEGKILLLNNQARKIYNIDDTDNKQYTIFDITSSEQESHLLPELWSNVLNNNTRVFEWLGRQLKTNREIPMQVSLNSTIWDDQHVIVAIVRDFTERKEFEKQIIAAKEKAEESDRLKTAFLANMSHEIRTPMNGIIGFTNLLKSPGLSTEDQQAYIEIIEKSGQRMLSTIQAIIDIAKIESGLEKTDVSTFNLNRLMSDLFEFFHIEAAGKNIQLTITSQLPDKNAHIQTDKEKLNSILTNLIKNAIKYTHKGSIDFGYSLDTGKEDPVLKFCIKDTGIGIPADRQQAVFNRFEQADIEDRAAYQGSGLGLAIAKSYVEMLGGKIWLESEPGVGSVFYFTLPYNTEAKIKAETKNIYSGDPLQPDSKLKILIVEDEEVAALYLQIILKEYGKEFLVTKSGAEAVKICKNNPDIDLVLMDIKVPEMNGHDATRKIREFNKNVFILAQTAYAQIGDREKCIHAGCNDFVSKPINKGKLLGIIDNFLKSE